jgi:t-SNARE complex subunit (syntaxin)
LNFGIVGIFGMFTYFHGRYPHAIEILHAIQNFPDQKVETLISEKCEILLLEANTYRAWCKYEQASNVRKKFTFKIEH